MPSYDLPKEKKTKGNTNSTALSGDDTHWRRRVSDIPADKAIIESLVVGDKFEILLSGTIKASELHDSGGSSEHGSFDLDTDTVAVYPKKDNEFTKLVDED